MRKNIITPTKTNPSPVQSRVEMKHKMLHEPMVSGTISSLKTKMTGIKMDIFYLKITEADFMLFTASIWSRQPGPTLVLGVFQYKLCDDFIKERRRESLC